jgi:hypothetical protein
MHPGKIRFSSRATVSAAVDGKKVKTLLRQPEDTIYMGTYIAGIAVKNQDSSFWLVCSEEPAMQHLAVTAWEKNVLRGETFRYRIKCMLAFGVQQQR